MAYNLSKPHTLLLSTFNNMQSFDTQLQQFTLKKCKIERNMETCTLEYLYFRDKMKQAINDCEVCFEKTPNEAEKAQCSQKLEKDFSLVKDELKVMVEVIQKEMRK